MPKPRDPDKAAENVRRLRRLRKLEGKCVDCGKSRGFNGTATRCRSCADGHNEKQRERREHERDPDGILAKQELDWQLDQLERVRKNGNPPVVIRSKSDQYENKQLSEEQKGDEIREY